ncbi:MAG TPA: glycosyltransferase [Rhodanobacter sp.]|nr:glycosyltransferase [Rhodanobacter sp.]
MNGFFSSIRRSKLAKRIGHAVLALNMFGWLPERIKLALIVRSGVFDWEWYRDKWLVGAENERVAVEHFLRHGSVAGYEPSQLFDSNWYRHRYSFRAPSVDLLVQYILLGDRIGLLPSPWFMPGYYRSRLDGSMRRYVALADFCRNWRKYPYGHPLFDQAWYLDFYPDVAESECNPLIHFVGHGVPEERRPNPFFIPDWYRSHNPDVAAAGLNPALHYFSYGAREGRSPGPSFDSNAYVARYPDVIPSGLDPLAHYLTIGREQGRDFGSRVLTVAELVAPKRLISEGGAIAMGVIDVIVPVYKGLSETRNCLESVLSSGNAQEIRVRIYNDCSPEKEVTSYLRQLVKRHPSVRLVENEMNLGFVRTVNSGMRAALEQDDCIAVLLLNSDTVVASGWVDRMAAHLPVTRNAGTVCALSNNATICSFPKLGENIVAPGFTAAEVDGIAAVVNCGDSVDIPTAVGFCMLIGRDCLGKTGFFDEEAFGRGYGEENDFCMRASKLGFRHLLAHDVFVHHVGEVSFAEVSKPGKLIAERVIADRYPDYSSKIASFVAADPSRVARLRLAFGLWRESGAPVLAIITHNWGGGTERHVSETDEQHRKNGHVVIIRPAEGGAGRIHIENRSAFDGFEMDVDVADGDGFARLLELMGVRYAQIHHLGGHGPHIREGLAKAGIAFDFMVHDYFTICPQITLTDINRKYCGEPDLNACDACIAQRPSNGASDIRNWRTENEWAVLGADRVIAPSQDAALRMRRYFGLLPEVKYHEAQPTMVTPRKRVITASARSPLRVVVLGVLARHKGLELVVKAAQAAKRRGIPMRFRLIGQPEDSGVANVAGALTWTGPYEESQLVDLIANEAPDVFLFASQAPETYSYTLTKAINTGLPIVATAIGAFPERLVDYWAADLVPVDIPPEDLVHRIGTFMEGISSEIEASR